MPARRAATSNEQMELVRGTLDMLILKTLDGGPKHGYSIARRIQQLSDELLKVEEGSLYPALHRMERRGWIEAQWGLSQTKRKAKYYRLTPAGHAQLAVQLELREAVKIHRFGVLPLELAHRRRSWVPVGSGPGAPIRLPPPIRREVRGERQERGEVAKRIPLPLEVTRIGAPPLGVAPAMALREAPMQELEHRELERGNRLVVHAIGGAQARQGLLKAGRPDARPRRGAVAELRNGLDVEVQRAAIEPAYRRVGADPAAAVPDSVQRVDADERGAPVGD